MIKAKVVDPNYPQYKDIIFDVTAIREYKNSLGETKTWYNLESDLPPTMKYSNGKVISVYSHKHLYFGEKQIELIDSEPYLK